MRILHLVNGAHVSGPERVVEHLVTGAVEAEGKVVALFDGEFRQQSTLPVSVITSRGRLDLSVVPRLAGLLRRERIDIVHTHTPRANLVGRLAGRRADCAVVSHVHSPTWAEGASRIANRGRAFVDDLTRGRSIRHIAVSEWLKAQLVRRGYPDASVDVCLNGVDSSGISDRVQLLRAEGQRAQLGLPPEAVVLGMFAMFRPRKGADILLRAFAASECGRNGAILVMVGGSYPGREEPYLETLRRLCGDLGIAEAVRFTGFVPDVLPWMAAADIAVMPSLYGEGLPMALLEQMAAGLPTIASNAPGIEEVLRATDAGVLVAPGSAPELARAMDALCADPERRGRLAAAAGAAAPRYSLSAMVDCVERTYRNVLDHGSDR